jgi:hypothetical protein
MYNRLFNTMVLVQLLNGCKRKGIMCCKEPGEERDGEGRKDRDFARVHATVCAQTRAHKHTHDTVHAFVRACVCA